MDQSNKKFIDLFKYRRREKIVHSEITSDKAKNSKKKDNLSDNGPPVEIYLDEKHRK